MLQERVEITSTFKIFVLMYEIKGVKEILANVAVNLLFGNLMIKLCQTSKIIINNKVYRVFQIACFGRLGERDNACSV